MRRISVVATAALLITGATGCAGARTQIAARAPQIAIAANPPPVPTTWPKYPRLSRHSCWGRPGWKGAPARSAPSFAPALRAHLTPPADIVRGFLSRFGDRRYIRAITLGPAAATIGTNVRALMQYGGHHPPVDALHAFIHAPLASYKNHARHATPAQHLTYGIAEFEAGLVGGALRDDFCSAGGAPLVSWSGGDVHGYAGKGLALEQRFPNPTPAAFRHRVAFVGRRFGFHVASLRLLRTEPGQFAPVLVVKTSRPRKAFVKDITKIMTLLSPTSFAPHLHRVALTFEGFFFAAEDERGLFVFNFDEERSQGEASGWAANDCLLPPMGPVTPKCP